MSSSRSDETPLLRIAPTSDFLASGLPLPSYQTSGSVGMDVRVCLPQNKSSVVLLPGERQCLPTGLRVQVPEGYELQTRPRSGVSLKTSLLMVNSPGTIDQDYRGETKLIMGNFGDDPILVHHGERIAQWVVAPVVRPRIEIVESLSDTIRGTGGFGSTGTQ